MSSAFHVPRTRATFDFCYSLAGRDLHGDASRYALSYHAASDEGLFEPEVAVARAAKEAAAVDAWRLNAARLRSLAALHAWLFDTHLCYAVGRQHEFGRHEALDPRLAATY